MHICCSNHSVSIHVHSYWIIQDQCMHKALWFFEKSDLGGLLHLHQTHAAVASNGQPFMVTESGDFYSCSSTRLEQRITFSNNTLQGKVLKSQKLHWLKYFLFYNRRFLEVTGEDNLTMFSYSGRVKSPEWRWQRRRADLRHFEIFRHGPIITYTRLPAGGTFYPICMSPTNSERLIGISDAFSAFVYGYLSSCPCAHCTPNKSVTTLRYTRRHGPRYTGQCPKALTECSPLDFRRSSIADAQNDSAMTGQL